MPYCSILECKSDSRRQNLKNGGISYHRFPKDATLKEKWIDATGRADWMPTKISTICSQHFLEDDFLISNKGYRYPKPTAFPCFHIVKFVNKPQRVNNPCSTSSLKRECVENVKSCDSKTELIKKTEIEKTQEESAKDIATGSNCSTLKKNKLKSQLRFCINKIKNKNLKIKRLQSKNRRLKEKINSINQTYNELEEKFAIAMENLDRLENSSIEVQALVTQEAINTAAGVLTPVMIFQVASN